MIKINDVNKVNDLKTAKTPKASGGESFSVYLKETMKPQEIMRSADAPAAIVVS